MAQPLPYLLPIRECVPDAAALGLDVTISRIRRNGTSQQTWGCTMNREGFLISERIDEITRMCEREQPIYEHISSFSIALYVFGHFKVPDLLSVDDIDDVEAGSVLKESFFKIEKSEIPSDYHIYDAGEKYLLVFGDPLFPTHFAVVADMQSQRPYFSKLNFFGSGFDSLDELKSEFVGKDGVGREDIAFYKMKSEATVKKCACSKIYTIKNDGHYSVLEYEY